MRPKVVHLATTHRATDPRIFQKECRTLAAAGYDVVYVVPHDRDEVIDGVQIRAVPIPLSGKERLLRTTRAVYRRALDEGPDAVYHLHDAELLVMGLMLKARGHTVVYDMHEDTPRQMLYQHWIPRSLRRPVGRAYRALELLGARVFDGLIAAEPVIRDRFPGARVCLVHNYPLVEEFSAGLPYAERPPHLAYIGAITAARGIRELVEAVGLLPEGLGVTLQVGGTFYPTSLREALEALPGWQRTAYHGFLSRTEVGALLGQARVGVVTFHPVERYLGNYPTKLFEYMAAGLPVVVSDFPQLRPFVAEREAGLLVDPLDAEAIAEAVRWLLEHPAEAEAMGERGRAAVHERYTWSHEARALTAFYDALLVPSSAGTPDGLTEDA